MRGSKGEETMGMMSGKHVGYRRQEGYVTGDYSKGGENEILRGRLFQKKWGSRSGGSEEGSQKGSNG